MADHERTVPVSNETGNARRPDGRSDRGGTPYAPPSASPSASSSTMPLSSSIPTRSEPASMSNTSNTSSTSASDVSDEAARKAREAADKAGSAASRASDLASNAASDAADSARGAANEAAERARRAAYDTASSAMERVDAVADDAISSVRQRADQVADQAKSTTQQYIATFGRALDAASQSLEQDGMSGTAGYVRAAANGLNDAAHGVEGFETQSLTGRVEDYVRERPMLTMGALALVGFAVASAMSNRNRRI